MNAAAAVQPRLACTRAASVAAAPQQPFTAVHQLLNQMLAKAERASCDVLCKASGLVAAAATVPSLTWLLLATLVHAGEDQGDAHYLYENTGAFPFLRANNKAVRRCLLALQAWRWHSALQRCCLLFALLLQPCTGSGATSAIGHRFFGRSSAASHLQSLAVIFNRLCFLPAGCPLLAGGHH